MSPLDPLAAGRAAAALLAGVTPRVFDDLVAAGAAPGGATARASARAEWDCFAMFACVRGLVAAGGFASSTVAAIDALHAARFEAWSPAEHDGDTAEARRALLARRYGEYEAIAQEGGAAGADTVAVRLGAAAARHLAGGIDAPADVAELLGSIHESLAEAVVALVKGEATMDADPAAATATPPAAGDVTTPPLEGALAIAARFEAAGLECALGGSGLLAALGLAREVGDWDLTTDAPRETLEAALAGLAWVYKGSDELHADEKFMFPDLELEVIRRFAFFVPGGVVHLPTRVTGLWNGLPLGSPEAWAVAYDLMGRGAKRDQLLGWLRRNGADRHAVDALLAQPVPTGIAAALASLPGRPE